jgi:hypothetical protein
VPNNAPYRSKHLLAFASVEINENPAVGDDAIHVVVYIGDTTGTGTYSSLDAQRILRVVSGLDSGFALFPLLDPAALADTTGNGSLSSLDATRILQEIVGLDRPEIPPLPGIVLPAFVADPLVNMPPEVVASGSRATVPVRIDDANLLQSVELEIRYDTTLLDVAPAGIRKGELAADATLIVNVDDGAGRIFVAMLWPVPLQGGTGSLLEIDYYIRRPQAAYTVVDFSRLALNEGTLELTETPIPGADPTDGVIRIRPQVKTSTMVPWHGPFRRFEIPRRLLL